MSKYRLWKQARADSGGWDRKTDGFVLSVTGSVHSSVVSDITAKGIVLIYLAFFKRTYDYALYNFSVSS